ncbi:thioredoxin F-type, chloroplastic-like [Chenopodium quinoa]|uniref:Thioredoxin domain-containing protein n=1 Tax=Chenopodium quinoa TaxID=63459 RepID=A0A803KMP0_CHEQI|nr:thioredoxin F-type, chloroplastic-like [Chenopodium quinoa]
MALNLSLSHQSWTSAANPITSSDPTRCSAPGSRLPRRVEFVGSYHKSKGVFVKRKDRMRGQVRASLEAVGTQEVEAIIGKVTQVNKDTFWPIVNAAGDKTVVLDMYTQWCGPCKAMAPKYEKLAEEYLDCIFLKLDCNQENKSLAKELGIRVVPTFKILKEGKIVEEVTGAKYDALVAAIQTVRSS